MLENKCEPLFRHRRRRVDPARAMEIDRAKRAGEDRTVHSEMPLRFRSDIAGGVIVVPLCYDSDLASIPQFAWSIFMASDDPRIELGGWVHDLLYQNHGGVPLENGSTTGLSRKQCDTILAYEAMPDLSATAFQCSAVYQALRRFGQGWPGDSFWERFT